MFFSATLAPWCYHLPILSALGLDGQACFYDLATTYGLFGPGTRKKTIKDESLTFDCFKLPKQGFQLHVLKLRPYILISISMIIYFGGSFGQPMETQEHTLSGECSLMFMQEWASETGGQARLLGMHALHLYTRSSSSRTS